jgi:hypothetical protein
MADDAAITPRRSVTSQPRVRIAAGVAVLAVAAIAIWVWLSGGHESTDDAQVDAHVTQIAARVGGTIQEVGVSDNQLVELGAVLVASIRAIIRWRSRKHRRNWRMRRPRRRPRKAPSRSRQRRPRAT